VLEFEAGYPPSGLGERPLFYDFGDFINYFVYQGTILVGAQTYDKEGNLLAEAIIIRYFITEKGEQGIEVMEIHYAEDNPVFKCKSLIDPYTGEKIKQMEEVGRRVRDYYFIWPMRIGRLKNSAPFGVLPGSITFYPDRTEIATFEEKVKLDEIKVYAQA